MEEEKSLPAWIWVLVLIVVIISAILTINNQPQQTTIPATHAKVVSISTLTTSNDWLTGTRTSCIIETNKGQISKFGRECYVKEGDQIIWEPQKHA